MAAPVSGIFQLCFCTMRGSGDMAAIKLEDNLNLINFQTSSKDCMNDCTFSTTSTINLFFFFFLFRILQHNLCISFRFCLFVASYFLNAAYFETDQDVFLIYQQSPAQVQFCKPALTQTYFCSFPTCFLRVNLHNLWLWSANTLWHCYCTFSPPSNMAFSNILSITWCSPLAVCFYVHHFHAAVSRHHSCISAVLFRYGRVKIWVIVSNN